MFDFGFDFDDLDKFNCCRGIWNNHENNNVSYRFIDEHGNKAHTNPNMCCAGVSKRSPRECYTYIYVCIVPSYRDRYMAYRYIIWF